LGIVYLKTPKYANASAILAEAVPVKERLLGRNSPELATLLRLYAKSLKAGGNYAAAEKVELKATRITTQNALMAQAQ
jgi:hypothetical protein